MTRKIRPLPTRKRGYAIRDENEGRLNRYGIKPGDLLQAAADNMTPWVNPQGHPNDLADPLNQKNMGSCQGNSLARCMSICYWLQTGEWVEFSRMAAYILSQKKDGIRGDRGSTLSAGMWVATQYGLCLDRHWPYPNPVRYSTRQPRGIADKFKFKMVAAKPTSDYGLVRDALKLGLPVQDGIAWDSSVSRTVCTNYKASSRNGGHSTLLWLMDNDNFWRWNSWGWWDEDGCNLNTPRALKQQVVHPRNTHVIYAPEGMIYPDREPVLAE